MVKWVCNSCNLRFDSESASNCPKCNRDNIEKDASAEDLLNEVEEILGE